MELNELMLLAAASILPRYGKVGDDRLTREKAVREAKWLWEEVLRQDHE